MCTGFRDMNGSSVYENDIVYTTLRQGDESKCGVVTYAPAKAAFMVTYRGAICSNFLYEVDLCTIVGSIYTSKSFLTTGQL